MHTVLVVGATRGLGRELVKKYASRGDIVLATSRSHETDESMGSNVKWIPNIDIAEESAGKTLAENMLKVAGTVDTIIITAGYFATETFDEPNWQEELKMYTISAIGPVFIVHNLVKSGAVKKGGKIIIVSSESGSITLRHESEGGGNYGHHASKTASNMVGKLLSLDLKDKGIAVGILHVRLLDQLRRHD
jgi:short-subunit dehydrogenase